MGQLLESAAHGRLHGRSVSGKNGHKRTPGARTPAAKAGSGARS
ncbi:Uncharacterised protein [Bordetella pertussis]|nr:Uncharacterised protein [Bordetella pertussis]